MASVWPCPISTSSLVLRCVSLRFWVSYGAAVLTSRTVLSPVDIHGGGSLHAAWAVSPHPRPQCVCPAQLGFWPHIRPQSEALSLAACLPVIWEAQVTFAAPVPSCTTVSTLASSSSWERALPSLARCSRACTFRVRRLTGGILWFSPATDAGPQCLCFPAPAGQDWSRAALAEGGVATPFRILGSARASPSFGSLQGHILHYPILFGL